MLLPYVSTALPSRFLAAFYQSGRNGHHSMSRYCCPVLHHYVKMWSIPNISIILVLRHHFKLHMKLYSSAIPIHHKLKMEGRINYRYMILLRISVQSWFCIVFHCSSRDCAPAKICRNLVRQGFLIGELSWD